MALKFSVWASLPGSGRALSSVVRCSCRFYRPSAGGDEPGGGIELWFSFVFLTRCHWASFSVSLNLSFSVCKMLIAPAFCIRVRVGEGGEWEGTSQVMVSHFAVRETF